MTLTDGMLCKSKDVISIGTVEGRVLQSIHTGTDNGSGWRTLDGDELIQHQERMNNARNAAMEKMRKEAETMGADAVVCVRISTAPGGEGTTEVTAYGTAVKYR